MPSIKKRSIHDNFIYTQNLVQCLHRQKIPALFLKLDISKAFDSVRWDYLMEVLEKMGFGVKWRSRGNHTDINSLNFGPTEWW